MIDRPNIDRAVVAAARNYRRFPNVCGVSFGAKYSDGKRREGVSAVQFFVTRKRDRAALRRSLPRYVYLRLPDGTIDHRHRLLTDVIEVRNLEMACLAGDELTKVGGSKGAAALIFEDKAGSTRRFAITCSHVAGAMSVSPEAGELRGGNLTCFFQSTSIANTTVANGELEFDVALCEISMSTQFADLGIRNSTDRCQGFGADGDLALDTELNCVSPISESRTVTVQSDTTEFRDVRTPAGDVVSVKNLFACRGIAVRGDSGGLVFRADRAVGIVVAKADDDWVFIHDLRAALAHLEQVSGLQITPFT